MNEAPGRIRYAILIIVTWLIVLTCLLIGLLGVSWLIAGFLSVCSPGGAMTAAGSIVLGAAMILAASATLVKIGSGK